jgi:hypothetical protein
VPSEDTESAAPTSSDSAMAVSLGAAFSGVPEVCRSSLGDVQAARTSTIVMTAEINRILSW